MSPIKKIIVTIVLAFIFCQVSFFFIKKEITKYECHNNGRLTELLYNKTNYDVLFIGSSRTHLIVNPYLIDSICHVNSYNAGVEGGNLFEFKMMLEAYLINHPSPKYLVLTLDLHSFISSINFFDYSQYLAFTKNEVIKNYLNKNGYNTSRLTYFPFLAMTDFDDNTKGYFFKGILGKNEILQGDFQCKGFLSNTDNQITDPGPVLKPAKIEFSDSRKHCLEDIYNICSDRGIGLILTYAPEYKQKVIQHAINSKDIFNYLDKFSADHKIPFFRDDCLDICNDPKLFANLGHLNRPGSYLYSQILAKHLNEYFKK